MKSLLITLMLSAATFTLADDKLRVWVQAHEAHDGNDPDLEDSAQDIIKKFKSKILELAESPEQADIIMTVMSRGRKPGRSLGITVPNKMTVTILIKTPEIGVMEFFDGQSGKNSWTACADNARKNAEKWIKKKFGKNPREGILAEVRRKADERAERLENLTNRWGNEDAVRIIKRLVWIGMTAGQLRESLGSPTDVNRTITAAGTKEQWVYGAGMYVYLEDDLVTAIQQ